MPAGTVNGLAAGGTTAQTPRHGMLGSLYFNDEMGVLFVWSDRQKGWQSVAACVDWPATQETQSEPAASSEPAPETAADEKPQVSPTESAPLPPEPESLNQPAARQVEMETQSASFDPFADNGPGVDSNAMGGEMAD